MLWKQFFFPFSSSKLRPEKNSFLFRLCICLIFSRFLKEISVFFCTQSIYALYSTELNYFRQLLQLFYAQNPIKSTPIFISCSAFDKPPNSNEVKREAAADEKRNNSSMRFVSLIIRGEFVE